jgi:hypothetical protein
MPSSMVATLWRREFEPTVRFPHTPWIDFSRDLEPKTGIQRRWNDGEAKSAEG